MHKKQNTGKKFCVILHIARVPFGVQVPVEDNFMSYFPGQLRIIHILSSKCIFFLFKVPLPKLSFKYFFWLNKITNKSLFQGESSKFLAFKKQFKSRFRDATWWLRNTGLYYELDQRMLQYLIKIFSSKDFESDKKLVVFVIKALLAEVPHSINGRFPAESKKCLLDISADRKKVLSQFKNCFLRVGTKL